MVEFNFLPEKKVVAIGVNRGQKRFFWFCLAIFLVLAALASGLGFYRELKEEELVGLKRRQQALVQVIASQEDRLTALVRLRNRIKGIKHVLEAQFDYATALSHFWELLPAGVVSQEVRLANNGALSGTLLASNSAALRLFLDRLTLGNQRYKEVTVGEITFQANTGKYHLGVSWQTGPRKKS